MKRTPFAAAIAVSALVLAGLAAVPAAADHTGRRAAAHHTSAAQQDALCVSWLCLTASRSRASTYAFRR